MNNKPRRYWTALAPIVAASLSVLMSACSTEQQGDGARPDARENTAAPAASTNATPDEPAIAQAPTRQNPIINAYQLAYNEKDGDAFLALHDDDYAGLFFPHQLVVESKATYAAGAIDDLQSRPDGRLHWTHHYQISANRWVAYGTASDGTGHVSMMVVFEFTDAGQIAASWTHLGMPAFQPQPNVSEPTAGMIANRQILVEALKADNIGAAASAMSEDVSLFAMPAQNPRGPAPEPIISGSGNVAAGLTQKWGEGAFSRRTDDGISARDDTFISSHMSYVFVGIPALNEGARFDRVAFVTFQADPNAADFEKIIRVDVMGPSGG